MEEMLLLAVIIILALIVLLLVVYLIDINYFLRIAFVFLPAYFKRKSLDFLDVSVIYGRVLPFDSDIQLFHMNNARVLREYDFGRLDLLTRTGLLDDHLRDLRILLTRPVFAAASVIRYRRQLHMFAKYKIITKVAYWEGNALYHEQKMVTVNDNITRNLGYCKVIFPFNIEDFLKRRLVSVKKPVPTKDLELWMRYNESNRMNTKISKSDLNEKTKEAEDVDDWSSSSN